MLGSDWLSIQTGVDREQGLHPIINGNRITALEIGPRSMNIDRIDLLLKYAILVAGSEDYGNRRLGPIHLIKFVYLGDLGYAEEHPGKTFTGAPWRFLHYGPWAEEVFDRVEPVMVEVGAGRHVFTSRFDKDAVRFELTDEPQRQTLEKTLPFEVARAIRNAVHEYGQATSDLLHYVYRTWPMLHAAPNEYLPFDMPARESSRRSPARAEITFLSLESAPIEHSPPNIPPIEHPVRPRTSVSNALQDPVSRTAKKNWEEKLKAARERIRKTLTDRKQTDKLIHPPIMPRYDEIFSEGVRMLDEIGGTILHPQEGELEIADDVWKSPFRTESDLP